MKIKIGILMLLAGVVIFSSCNNNKTYADMKKAQKKAINKFISARNVEVLHKWPTDSIFEENQFLLLDNGVYLNIVDSGNGNRAIQGKTKILMRCSGEYIFDTDTGAFSLFTNSNSPIEFTYGYASDVISQSSTLYSYYNTTTPEFYYLSKGIESILEYVGENAVVKLIVPFEEGSGYQTNGNYGAPLYYDKVRYQFY
ncbi:MAG: DUF4827 domain-containing protein [Tannerella sp.]|jgi:hypothetical protein|nr:DUF4827 domain-containing protein [Tannerella sp.]